MGSEPDSATPTQVWTTTPRIPSPIVSLLERLIGSALHRHHQRRSRGRSLAELADALAASADTVTERIAAAADTPANREAANHIYGIESWGRNRLGVARGAPLVLDGYRPYRLPDDTPIAELAAAFAAGRAATVTLARELAAAGIDPATTVRHNDLGELSVAGWLHYLEAHASRESRWRLR